MSFMLNIHITAGPEEEYIEVEIGKKGQRKVQGLALPMRPVKGLTGKWFPVTIEVGHLHTTVQPCVPSSAATAVSAKHAPHSLHRWRTGALSLLGSLRGRVAMAHLTSGRSASEYCARCVCVWSLPVCLSCLCIDWHAVIDKQSKHHSTQCDC
jgi:hypothetical protein